MWNSLGKNTGVGCHFLLQISPAQGSNPQSPVLAAAAAAKSLQSCPTLCDPRNCSLPGSSVHGILQARTLQWVAIAFSTVYSEAGTYVGIWKVKRNLIYDSLENFAMQEEEYNLRD